MPGTRPLTVTMPDSAGVRVPVLSVSGLFSPYTPETIISIDWDAMFETTINILSINDMTLKELLSEIARPAFEGVLRFLVEMPASSCQSIMDDLESYGILQTALK